jgi:hypothetical protein
MDSTTIIRVVAGLLCLGVIAIGIVYISFLSGILRKCSPASRTMEPGMVWLLLVPLVNIVWNFLVVSALAKSLANEFRLRNIPSIDPEPGKSIGIAMCVCGACSIIPILGILAGLGNFALWIAYWSKMAEFSRRLDLVPAVSGIPVGVIGS